MKKILPFILFFIFQILNAQEATNMPPDQDENSIYHYSGIEVKPEYPGGLQEFYKYIGSSYNVPNVKGLSGKVFMSFVVEKDGSLSDIKAIRDIGYGTGQEAVRVLKIV